MSEHEGATTVGNLIQQLRRLDAAATPGPWHRNDDHNGAWGGWDIVTDEWLIALTPDDDDEQDPTPRANAELIAEVRNAVPVLLEAADIVRDLATLSQIWVEGRPGDPSAWVIACRCTTPDHRPGCPWRRAVELSAALDPAGRVGHGAPDIWQLHGHG